MKKKILRPLVATMAIGLCSSAFASTITNLDLVAATPFNGFDWSGNGTVVSTPGPAYRNGDAVTSYYFADAKTLDKVGGGSFITPNMILGAPGGGAFAAGKYEYTVVATLSEIISCGVGPIGTPCGALPGFFTAIGGTWDVYYDYAGNAFGDTIANQITGTGFTDGTKVLSGLVDPGFAGVFVPTSATSGTGSFSFEGPVTYTNSTYISPDQGRTNATSTLQRGTFTTNWTAPTGTPFGALPPSNITFQADAQQALQVMPVPEPTSVALFGIALLGVFARSTRRKQLS